MIGKSQKQVEDEHLLHASENKNVLRCICRIFALNGSEWQFALWSTVASLVPNLRFRKVVSVHFGDEQVRGELLGFLATAKAHIQNNFIEDYNRLGDPEVFWTKYQHHLAHHISHQIYRLPGHFNQPHTVESV
jgi:abortive infection bacteriophage resistance protein